MALRGSLHRRHRPSITKKKLQLSSKPYVYLLYFFSQRICWYRKREVWAFAQDFWTSDNPEVPGMQLFAFRQDISNAHDSLGIQRLPPQRCCSEFSRDSHLNDAIWFYPQTSESQKWSPREYFQQSLEKQTYLTCCLGRWTCRPEIPTGYKLSTYLSTWWSGPAEVRGGPLPQYNGHASHRNSPDCHGFNLGHKRLLLL